MVIKLIDKETMECIYEFETDKKNTVILDGELYELSDNEYIKFIKGEYMEEHLKFYKEHGGIEEFDLGLYIMNAPYSLEDYILSIE